MLSTKQMARRYGVSPRTLERLRVQGGGPSFFIKIGKQVRYPDDSTWVKSGLRGSTSEEGTLKPLATTYPDAKVVPVHPADEHDCSMSSAQGAVAKGQTKCPGSNNGPTERSPFDGQADSVPPARLGKCQRKT
jgi:hypothetical protein